MIDLDENSNDGASGMIKANSNITLLPRAKSKQQTETNSSADHQKKSDAEQSIGYIDVAQMKPLQKAFGRFVPFNGGLPNGMHITALKFIDAIQKFVGEHHPGTDLKAVATHFYCLIDKSLYGWFFALDNSKHDDWPTFAKCFVDEVERIEQQQRAMVHLGQKEFNDKLLELYPNDADLKKDLDTHPTRTFFDYKRNLIQKVYRDVTSSTAISIALTLMSDQARAARYRKMIDPNALKYSIKLDDEKAQT